MTASNRLAPHSTTVYAAAAADCDGSALNTRSADPSGNGSAVNGRRLIAPPGHARSRRRTEQISTRSRVDPSILTPAEGLCHRERLRLGPGQGRGAHLRPTDVRAVARDLKSRTGVEHRGVVPPRRVGNPRGDPTSWVSSDESLLENGADRTGCQSFFVLRHVSAETASPASAPRPRPPDVSP